MEIEELKGKVICSVKLTNDTYQRCVCISLPPNNDKDKFSVGKPINREILKFEIGKEYACFENIEGGNHTVYLRSSDWIGGLNGKITNQGRQYTCFFYGDDFEKFFKIIE